MQLDRKREKLSAGLGKMMGCHPKYDAEYLPIYYMLRAYRKRLEEEEAEEFSIGILRNKLLVERKSFPIIREGDKLAKDIAPGKPLSDTARLTIDYVDRLLKSFLWIVGGNGLFLKGPKWLVNIISERYQKTGARSFDRQFFERIFKQDFFITSDESEFLVAEEKLEMPWLVSNEGLQVNSLKQKELKYENVIGLDLGASLLEVSALHRGKLLFQAKKSWTPKRQNSPAYHYEEISKAIHEAKAALSGLDFIGISSPGVVLNNQIRESSLFRKIPLDKTAELKELFPKISERFGHVPYRLVNDGEVSALAGRQVCGGTGILSLTFGTSLGAGYINPDGEFTNRTNELAFVPVDVGDRALEDEWSKDTGVGVSYFSQDAAIKLAKRAGIDFRAFKTEQEAFRHITLLLEEDDPRAKEVFRDMGIYLAYTIPFYREWYDFSHLFLQGGVMAGEHGKIIRKTASELVEIEFPELAGSLSLIDTEKLDLPSLATTAAFLHGG